MIGVEEKLAKSLSSSVKGLNTPIVKELLMSISHDSKKHAGLYSAIRSLVKGDSKAMVEEEFDQLEKVIKKHIIVESQMLQEVRKLLEGEKDSRIKHLLIEISKDEIRHHSLLQHLLESVVKRETIFKADVWQILWGDVPGHGTP